MKVIIGALVAMIALRYLIKMFIARGEAAMGAAISSMPGAAAPSVLAGIIGATVMPHAVHLHSGLTQNCVAVRDEEEQRKPVQRFNIEVALSVAGLASIAMTMAASAFHAGVSAVAKIETAYHILTPRRGGGGGVPRVLDCVGACRRW
jgi:manganese transport protein